MRKAIVKVHDSGRRSYLCPNCEGRGTLLKQGEVFAIGGFPAPGVQVRRCKSCGTYFEFDKWSAERTIWRGLSFPND